MQRSPYLYSFHRVCEVNSFPVATSDYLFDAFAQVTGYIIYRLNLNRVYKTDFSSLPNFLCVFILLLIRVAKNANETV